jgi:hypothetical protein
MPCIPSAVTRAGPSTSTPAGPTVLHRSVPRRATSSAARRCTAPAPRLAHGRRDAGGGGEHARRGLPRRRGRGAAPRQGAAGRHLLGDLAVRPLGGEQSRARDFGVAFRGAGRAWGGAQAPAAAARRSSWRRAAFGRAAAPPCRRRLLGNGKSVTDVWSLMASSRASSDASGSCDQLLSEEERLAQRALRRAARSARPAPRPRHARGRGRVHAAAASRQHTEPQRRCYQQKQLRPASCGRPAPDTTPPPHTPRPPTPGCQQLLALLGVKTSIDDIRVRSFGSACGRLQALAPPQPWPARGRCRRLRSPPLTPRAPTFCPPPQGCSDAGGAPLLARLAELVVAVDAQRHAPHGAAGGSASCGPSSSGGGSSTAGGGPAAAVPWATQQLLEAACEAGGRLWSEAMQLFPRDMGPLLEAYR